MNNKNLGIVCIIAIAIFGTFNINMINSGESDVNLKVILTSANAQTETTSNHWTQWIPYGFTKDEREYERSCPTEQSTSTSGNASSGGNSAGGSHSSSQTNPTGRNELRCATGTENCDVVDC